MAFSAQTKLSVNRKPNYLDTTQRELSETGNRTTWTQLKENYLRPETTQSKTSETENNSKQNI